MNSADKSFEDAGTANSPEQGGCEQAIKNVLEKEKELDRRTETLENTIRLLFGSFCGMASSTPTDSCPEYAPPQLNHPLFARDYLSSMNNQSNSAMNPHLVSPYPKSYLRDALDLVPKYDGHNIPVWQFARACKRAKESVPLLDEPQFVRMLRNKLSHHAYLAVEDEVHVTVDKFLDTLKKTFGPGRSSNYYRGQLSIAYKKPAEHILDYIGRIKDLRTAIIEGDQTNSNRPLTESELSSIDSFTLEAFYEGLPCEYRVELRAEGYNSLADACSKTIIIDKRLEREEARNRGARNLQSSATPANRILQRDSLATSQSPSPSNIHDQSGYGNGARKICSYCHNFGHLISECRKRKYREGLLPRGNDNNDDSRNANLSPHAGNGTKVSVDGTPRGLGKARPVLPIESMPDPSTSSGAMTETYPPSNSNPIPF